MKQSLFKKVCAVVMVLLLTVSFCPTGTFSLTASAASVGNLTYTISNGEATITACDTTAAGEIVIPSTVDGVPVTAIASLAFKSCKAMTSVVIPDGVTTIEKWTFYSCTALVSVTLPDSVTTVVEGAFENCRALTDVWYGGDDQADITIDATNTKLLGATWHYNYCAASETKSHLYDHACDADCNACGKMREVDGHAYDGVYDTTCGVCGEKRDVEGNSGTSGVLSYTIVPDTNGGVVIITACDTSVVGEVIIPSTIDTVPVTRIGPVAFKSCKGLTSVVIPDSVTNIEKWAFYACSGLTTVVLPAGVTTIVDGAFQNCHALADVWYGGSSQDAITIGADNTKLVNATWHYGACNIHSYDHACDVDCNECGWIRVVGNHVYDNACDADCNECGATREVGDHVYDDYNDTDCNECGQERAGVPVFVVNTVSGAPGQEVQVIVSIKNNPGIVAFKLDVGYDTTVLEPIGITEGVFADTVFGPIINQPIEIDWVRANEANNTTNGEIAVITFMIKKDAPRGVSPITVTVDDPDNVFNYDFENVTFEMVDGSVTVFECKHEYDNACDAACNECGALREVADHVYDNTCDADCNECGAVREVADHVYDNACDADCNECGAVREVADHVYDNACDADCNECGAVREVADHVYDNACDADCNECGAVREVADHVYNNACDADCNECGALREVADHVYGNACDVDCNECGATREVGDHVYDDYNDTDCNECGHVREKAPIFAVSSGVGRHGQTVQVIVSIENNPGIVSAKLDIDYDSTKLELVEYAQQDFTGMTFGPIENDPFAANWCDALNSNNTTNGVFVVLTFRVKDDAEAGFTPITVSYDAENVYDFDFENVTFDTVDGGVEILKYVPGDVNGDGAVNNKDIGLLQRYINGWSLVIDELAADVTGDGSINNKDLGILQRYVNGWEIELA